MFNKDFLIVFIFLMQNPILSTERKEVGEAQNASQGISFGKVGVEIDPNKKIIHTLFLCTGNSCRSQMAEGWARHLGSDVAEVNSAGIKAHGLNPNAVKVMKEKGIDITSQSSKVVTPEMISWADLVVTVCGDADENCPLLPSKVKKIHWPIVDPAKATGTEEGIMKQFREVREEIHQQVIKLLTVFREKL